MHDSGSPVLDLTYLREATEGDLSFMKEILRDYLGEMDNHLQGLGVSLPLGELELVMRGAHTIKGASANVGAIRVRDTAARLESQALRGSLSGGDVLLVLLRQELRRVKELLERETVEGLLNAGP